MELLTLGDFEPLIKSVARSKDVNSIVSYEDVEQELRIKVWDILSDILPDIEEMNRVEVFSSVKRSLQRQLTDIIRYYSRRPDTSIYSKLGARDCNEEEGGYDFDSLMTDELSNIFSSISKDPDQYIQAQQIVKMIVRWSRDKNKKVKQFIRCSLNPPKAIRAEWKILQDKTPRLKSFGDYIPPHTLIKLLGITQHEYYKFTDDLREFLSANKYQGARV